MSGLFAALWLLGVYAAAPALRTNDRGRYDVADRLRDALIVGIAIPFVLGLLHLLYPVACWAALALCIAVARLRDPAGRSRSRAAAPHLPYTLIAALLLVSWPQLMRPLLDGDSLSYHLPNAAVWAQTHSLWNTATRYWWYPPGSELFASALYTVGGPFAVPWSGFCALALLGFRIAAWARETSGVVPASDALAAATVSAYPLAIQGGTLQNDVWLAAFFLEALWSLRTSPVAPGAQRALAITALVKPQGWIFAAIALLVSRARASLWLAAFTALGVWVAHDAILWQSAGASPAPGLVAGALYGSTILAHGAAALVLLVFVALRFSPFALAALGAALLGPLLARRDRALGWAALASVLLFLVLPFGYATNVAQLANGNSLRFAAPAIAVGAIILAGFIRRIPFVALPLLWISTIYGCAYVLAIFWNDNSTHVALAIAAVAVVVAAVANLRRLTWPNALAFGLGVLLSTHLAARHAIDYYNDALSVNGVSPGVYRWIAQSQPAAVAGWGLRLGVVNVLAPRTRTFDVSDAQPCGEARSDGALLVAVAQSDLPSQTNARRLSAARACGQILHQDAIGVVTRP
ncbi:MAG: hypothetical protein WAK16_11475 [Candidatus Cybelea sp.]